MKPAPANRLRRGSDDAGRISRRRIRQNARDALRSVSTLRRVRGCGVGLVVKGGAVQVRVRDGVAGFGGVETCANRWACPVCSARILDGRASEAEQAVRGWVAKGGRIGMLTLTMRHSAGDSLASLWDNLSAAWRYLVQSDDWRAWRSLVGMKHYLRATEVTHGAAGWHVHLHVLCFLDPPEGVDVEATHAAGVFDRWGAGLARVGCSAWSKVQDWRVYASEAGAVDELGRYVAKAEYPAHLEVARGDLKRGRFGNRTPFQILEGIVSSLDAGGVLQDADLALWGEYEDAAKGRRGLVWSRGARAALLADEPERSDEELASEEVGTDEDTVLLIPSRSWWKVCARPGGRCDVLEAAEGGGAMAVRVLLARWGLTWRDPAPPEREAGPYGDAA